MAPPVLQRQPSQVPAPLLRLEPERNTVRPGVQRIDGMDFSEIGALLRANVAKILAIATLCFLLVLAATLLSKMTFASSGRLYLGELEQGGKGDLGTSSELDLSGSTASEVDGEVEIIRSRSLIRTAIAESGLNVRIRRAGDRPVRFWEWLASRRDPKLLNSVANEVLANNADLGDGEEGPALFELRFSEGGNYELRTAERVVGQGILGKPFQSPLLNITLTKGESHEPRPGATYELFVTSQQVTAQNVVKELEVSAPQKAGQDPVKVVSLNYASDSPRLASKFLEHLMDAYLQRRQEWKTEEASAAEEFVSQQLAEMRKALQELEDKLAEYRSNNRVVVLEDEAEAMVSQIGKYEEQRVTARLEVGALADVKRSLDKPDAPIEAFMLGEAKDTVLEGLAASLFQDRQKLARLKSRFSDAAPEVRQQTALVESQLAAIRSYVDSRLSRARQSLGTLNGIIGQYEDKLKSVPGAELRLAQLMRESEVYSGMYSSLLERRQQAAIIKASDVSKNRILDPPDVALREASPKVAFALAGAPLGILVGAAWVLIGALFGGTFRSEVDVRRHLEGVPVAGSVPHHVVQSRVGMAAPLFEADDGAPEFVEAFRTLRARISRLESEKRQKVILISSPGEGDGKTTCALWLASMLAADEKRVLLIDGDLRHPSHHLLLSQNRRSTFRSAPKISSDVWPGVPHLVSGAFGKFYSVSLERVPSVDHLRERMERFLAYVRTAFDFVLIDCASYPSASDAMVLSDRADMLLSLIRLRSTRRKVAVEHLEALGETGTPLAIVINDTPSAQKTLRTSRAVRVTRPDPVRVAHRQLEASEGVGELPPSGNKSIVVEG